MHVRGQVLVAAGLLASLTRPAAAQGPFSLDIGGGPSIPLAHAATNAQNVGFDGLVGVNLHAPFIPFSLRLDGLYNEYDHTRSELGARQIWAVSSNVVYRFPTFTITPYVMAGAGYYHTSENLRNGPQCNLPDNTPPPFPGCTTPTVPTLTASRFGIDGGAGLRKRLFGFGPGIGIGLFAEVRYQRYFGPHASGGMVPLIFGVNFPSVVEGN